MVERNDYIVGCWKPNQWEKVYVGEKMDHFPQGIGVKIVEKKLKFHHRFEERVHIFRLRKKTLGSKHEAIDFWRQKIRRTQGVPNVAGIKIRDIYV